MGSAPRTLPGRSASRSRAASRGQGRAGAAAAPTPAELARAELLAALPPAALSELAAGARVCRHAAGETLFREGDPGDTLHVVRSGALVVLRPSRDPGLVLGRLTAGHAFGELAVLTGDPRLASIVAVEPSETIEVHRDRFDRVLAEHPDAARRMLGAVARSLTLAKEQLTRDKSQLEAKVRQRTADLRESQLEVVRRLSHACESRDDDTGVHTTRMSRMCARLGESAGLEAGAVEHLLHAASMHDIGKIGIPDRVLLKAGPLSEEEWELMRTHTVIGAQMLSGSRSPVMRMGEVIARSHHEKWDGTGYPDGLRGEEIPLVARICAVCDVFDALVSDRPYKDAWPVDEALGEVQRLAGRHLDPRLVELFLRHRPDRPGRD